MAGGIALAFLHPEHMAIKDYDVGLPVVAHVVAVDSKTGAFTATAGAEEPGGAFGQFSIQGIPGEGQFAFVDGGAAICPDLQGSGVDFGVGGGNQPVLELNADIAGELVESIVFVILAVVSADHRLIFAFGHVGIEGVPAFYVFGRAEGEQAEKHTNQ